jgi:hypothetical protein
MQLIYFLLLLLTFTICFSHIWPSSGVLLAKTVSLCGISHMNAICHNSKQWTLFSATYDHPNERMTRILNCKWHESDHDLFQGTTTTFSWKDQRKSQIELPQKELECMTSWRRSRNANHSAMIFGDVPRTVKHSYGPIAQFVQYTPNWKNM